MTIDERVAQFPSGELGERLSPDLSVARGVRLAAFTNGVVLDVRGEVYVLAEATVAYRFGPPPPPTPTAAGLQAIWLHQFDRAGVTDLVALVTRWASGLYVKALDGVTWMTAFDRSPLAVDGPSGSAGNWTWAELGWIPWTVPTATAPWEEGILTGQLAEQAGAVILDLEPYVGFWRGTPASAETFLEAYGQMTAAPLRISLDHRRLRDGFPYASFMDAAVGFLPQVYWTDFQRPWRTVLEEAEAALAPFGKPIEYVLPGNAAPVDFAAGRAWCDARGAAASVWVWQTIRSENWPEQG